jgi:hypothetical protein
VNYVRTTPLDMVCRGADRDLLYQKNEFNLQVSDNNIGLPMQEVENQPPNMNSVSYYEPQSHLQPMVHQNISENVIQTEHDGKLLIFK